MIPNSKIQEVATPVMANAANIGPNAMALPAVPFLKDAKGKSQDQLKGFLERELPELCKELQGEMVVEAADPGRKDGGQVTEKAAGWVKGIKQFIEFTKKRLGGDITTGGIAMRLREYVEMKGVEWLGALPTKDMEAEAKGFSQFMNREGEFKMGNFKTVPKEFIIKEASYEKKIAEAVGGDLVPGFSFFGNVYIKKMEHTQTPGDPAHGGDQISKEKEPTAHFEGTIKYEHNTFTIKDDEVSISPAFVKTGSEITAYMLQYIEKHKAKILTGREASMEIQMLMEYNVPAG